MVRISSSELKVLNNSFSQFKNRIIQSKKQDNTYFVSQLNKYRKEYKHAGLEDNFADSIFEFAEQMRELGIFDFAGIIYSSLMKMPFIKPKVREIYALKGLELAVEQNDSIHTLARLVDLEKLYKQTKEMHKYTRILFREERILIKICNDFKGAKRNYKTYSREHSPLAKYEMELAKTRVDIAKVILKSDPKRAEIILTKARATFEREGRDKEVKFIDLMLSEIK